jgi:hypothetical protein
MAGMVDNFPVELVTANGLLNQSPGPFLPSPAAVCGQH